MSDATHEAPEQIWAWGWRADSVWQEQTWQHEDEPMSTMKYILATPAALSEAPEVQALIAEAVEKATRVKPLVWREVSDGNHRKGEVFSTRSPVSFAPIAAHKKHDGWWLNVDCKTYPSLEAAQAAAQADHEQRIRAAIGGTENE